MKKEKQCETCQILSCGLPYKYPCESYQPPINMKKGISHINPNCLGIEYCEPHGERGEVYYSSKNVLKIIQQERERMAIKLEKLRDDAKKYPAKYYPDFPEKSNGYNEGFNQAIRDVIEIINPLNQ